MLLFFIYVSKTLWIYDKMRFRNLVFKYGIYDKMRNSGQNEI